MCICVSVCVCVCVCLHVAHAKTKENKRGYLFTAIMSESLADNDT